MPDPYDQPQPKYDAEGRLDYSDLRPPYIDDNTGIGPQPTEPLGAITTQLVENMRLRRLLLDALPYVVGGEGVDRIDLLHQIDEALHPNRPEIRRG